MKKFKTIIVDDEFNATSLIQLLLQEDEEIELVASCENGLEAIDAIQTFKPDIVFLDIQMPEVDGFEVIKRVQRIHKPYYIFTTAYDEFAVKAFEVNAVDYLLKPFSDARFIKALEKAKRQVLNNSFDAFSEKLATFIEGQGQKEINEKKRKISVKVDGRILLLDMDSIQWIEADNQYVKIHTTQKTYLIRDSLNRISEELDEGTFYRCHRSAIININEIREFEPYFKGDFYIYLNSGTKVKLSRSRKEELWKMLNW